MSIKRWIPRRRDSAQAAFDHLSLQIEARARELEGSPEFASLCCERTPSRIRIYGRLYPRITVELDYEKRRGFVAMRRYLLEHPSGEAQWITNLRYPISGARPLNAADYRRLARQILVPLVATGHSPETTSQLRLR